MLIKVISTKTVFGDKEKILETVMKDKTKEHLLFRVFGVIEGHKVGVGKHKRVDKETGEAVDTYWTKFFGEFYAIRAADGTPFNASTCFLPDYVSGQFVTELDNNSDASIKFAYDVFAVYNKDSITSYEFIAVPVRPASEESPIKAMLEQLPPMPGQGPAQLTGPETKAKK